MPDDNLTRNVNLALLLDFYGEVLSGKQREALELWCGEDLSLAEIAEICGITRAGVRDRIVKAEKILTDLEEKLGLIARVRTLTEAVNELADRLAAADTTPETAESIAKVRRLIDEL